MANQENVRSLLWVRFEAVNEVKFLFRPCLRTNGLRFTRPKVGAQASFFHACSTASFDGGHLTAKIDVEQADVEILLKVSDSIKLSPGRQGIGSSMGIPCHALTVLMY